MKKNERIVWVRAYIKCSDTHCAIVCRNCPELNLTTEPVECRLFTTENAKPIKLRYDKKVGLYKRCFKCLRAEGRTCVEGKK